MAKPPATDILGWYVNKLYKKALDHCLQQSTDIPVGQGQVYSGQGHSANYVRSPGCNSMLNGDLSTCTRAVHKDDPYQGRKGHDPYQFRKGQGEKSNIQSHVSRSSEVVKQRQITEHLKSTSQEMYLRQQQCSRRLHENTILSERRYTVNIDSDSYVGESDTTGYCNIGRQHMNERENFNVNSLKLQRDTTSNLKSDKGFYGQKDGYSQQNLLCSRDRHHESELSPVVTHDLNSWGQRTQLPVFKESDDLRNSRFEMLKKDVHTLKPQETDMLWFRHSVQPQQTNIQGPISRPSFSKDDSELGRQQSHSTDRRKFGVPSNSSLNEEKESNNLIPSQHYDSVNKGKGLSQCSCPHQYSVTIDSKRSESTAQHHHSVNTNTQFLPCASSDDSPVTKTSIDPKKTQTFKSSIFFSLKSNHNSDQGLSPEQSCTAIDHTKGEQNISEGVESTDHSLQLRTLNTCDVQPRIGDLEPCEQLKPATESPASSRSPKATSHQANTEDTSAECLQNLEKEATQNPLGPNERLKAAPNSSTTPSTSASSINPVSLLQISSHKVPSTSDTEPENSVVPVPNSVHVVPLSDENLKLHEVLSGSSPSQDNGADSDSGDSCKSGVVIKPGHSNQKRKRSLSEDKKGKKRKSSGTTGDKISKSSKTRRSVQGNRKLASVPGKFSRSRNTDKNSKKKEKRFADIRCTPLRSCQRKSANVTSKLGDSKTTEKKKDKNALQTQDKSNKKTNSEMPHKKTNSEKSEHLKQCIGREISILKAHEDQAMSIHSESVSHSIDSKRLSSLAFLDLKDLVQVPEPCKSLENQSVYMSRKHVGGVWNSIVKK